MADRRATVTKGVEAGLSVRRPGRLVGLERKTFRYRSRRPRREDLRVRLRVLAEERIRWGYRRLHALLRPEGIQANHRADYALAHAALMVFPPVWMPECQGPSENGIVQR